MLLILIGTVWLALVGIFLAFSRMAAAGDGRWTKSSRSADREAIPHTIAAGLVVWEQEPPDLERELRKLMLRGRGAPTRGARSAA